MSQAREFRTYINKHPQDKNNPEIWKKFKVAQVLYTWDAQGFYRAHSFDFKDESVIEGIKIYD